MNKNEQLFSNPDCLSFNEMMDYIQDRVSLKERNRLERHMMECDLCNDAIEGYSSMRNEKSVLNIHQNIQRELGRKYKRFEWTKLAAILATTFIIGGLGYYMKDKLNGPTVLTFAKNEEKLHQDSIKSAISKLDSILALDTNKPLEEEFSTKSSSDGLVETQKDLNHQLSKNRINKNFDKINTPNIQENNSEGQKGFNSEGENTNITSIDVKESDQFKESMTEEKEKSNFNENRSVSPSSMTDVISVKPNIMKSKDNSKKMQAEVVENVTMEEGVNYLEKGKGYFQSGKYKEAINSFTKVEPPSKEYEESLWYLGLSYLQLNQINDAKATFEKVIKLTGNYKEKAIEELEKIK
jgi:tetratricopeptide (TPR) repeat protein